MVDADAPARAFPEELREMDGAPGRRPTALDDDEEDSEDASDSSSDAPEAPAQGSERALVLYWGLGGPPSETKRELIFLTVFAGFF